MINEDIKVIISVLGLGISAIGLVVSILANLKSHNANKISQAGVEKAEEANRISKEANNTAARSLEVSKRENISRFAIEITDIEWDNDGFLSDTIDEALRCGTFRCRFKVENLSINKALFMGFEKEPSQLRSKGVHVSVENYVQIENNFSLYCLLEKEPIYDVKICKNNKLFRKTEWRYETQLYWDNGVYSCSCKLAFEFGIEEYDNDERQECKLYLINQKECATSDYKIEEIFK